MGDVATRIGTVILYMMGIPAVVEYVIRALTRNELLYCVQRPSIHCRGRIILTRRQNVTAGCLNFAKSRFAVPDRWVA